MNATGCTATNNTNAYYSQNQAWLWATSTSGNNSGNTTDYSPSGTGYREGNAGGWIYHT